VIGNSVVVGHVSDRRDRPGAFARLSRARRGQIVTVRQPDGQLLRFRVISSRTYLRSRPLPRSLFATTGPHRLVLISCTDKETRPDGRWHYTRNRVVIAEPVD
jgi:hypothetical protein